MPEQDIRFRLYVKDAATGKLTEVETKVRAIGTAGTTAATKLSSGMTKAKDRADQLTRTLGRLQRTLTAIAGVWVAREVIRGFESLVKSGIEYNKTLEQTRIGIGAVIAAQTSISDAVGRELEGRQKIVAAQRIASAIQQDLLQANLRTAATYQQLVTMFQQALPHALAEGFNIKQIEEFVTAMSQAATAMGIPLNMMAEEMRSMLKGTITAKNTLIAVALGLDKQVIKSLQGSGQKLFDYLMGYLKAFQESSNDIMRSWSGLLTNMKQVFEMTLGDAFRPLFDELKQDFADLTEYLKGDEFKEWAKSVSQSMIGIARAVKSISSVLGISGGTEIFKVGTYGVIGTWLFGPEAGATIAAITAIKDLLDHVTLNTPVTGTQGELDRVNKEIARARGIIANLQKAMRGYPTPSVKRTLEAEQSYLAKLLVKKRAIELRMEEGTSKEVDKIRKSLAAEELQIATKNIDDLADIKKKAKEKELALLQDVMNKETKYIQQGLKNSKKYTDETEKIKEKAIQKELSLLQTAMDEETNYIEKGPEAFKELYKGLDIFSGDMVKLSQRTAEAMQDAFSNFFFDVMQGKFKGLGQLALGVLSTIQRAIADYLGQQLFDALFPKKKSSGGGLMEAIFGGVTSALLGGAVGGGATIATAPTGGYYAMGDTSWADFYHKGGVVGATEAPTRPFPSSIFSSAPRLHSGLGPDEFPAILQRGETVLPRGKKAGDVNNIYIYAVDAKSFYDLAKQNPAAIIDPLQDQLRLGNQSLRNTLRRSI